MRKPVTTIEGLDKKIDHKFDKFSQILEHIQGSIEVLVKKVAENTSTIDDNTSSIQFLIGNALMRDEVRQIVREEIAPVESRLLAAMNVIIGKHQKTGEEVLGHDYRIARLETTIGLGTAV